MQSGCATLIFVIVHLCCRESLLGLCLFMKKNPLIAPVSLIVKANPQGISEFDLIQCLQAQCDFIPGDFSGDSLSLFRTHFLLFNALYQLQVLWLENEQLYLQVDALSIRAFPAGAGDEQRGLSAAGDAKLRAYYLDLNRLVETQKEDVESLLTQFWEKYTSSDQRIEALSVLGLSESVSFKEIKQQYRRKAMACHPDRGGDKETLQQLNAAMEVLKRYYC